MTWHADVTEGRPKDEKLAKVLETRAKLIAEIEALKVAPFRGKSNAEAQGRIEDLTALAKKVTAIDRRLGRIE